MRASLVLRLLDDHDGTPGARQRDGRRRAGRAAAENDDIAFRPWEVNGSGSFIFDILHFVRDCFRHDKPELRPLLDHVPVLPIVRRPISHGRPDHAAPDSDAGRATSRR